MNTNSICINCKWHKATHQYEGSLHRCFHPSSAKENQNLVTGEVTIETRSCAVMRLPTVAANRYCGPKGVFFEELN